MKGAWVVGALSLVALAARADTGIPADWQTEVAAGVQTLQNADLFVGASTGYLQNGASAIWNFGVADTTSQSATNDRSIYEIGSVSKSFVGILLAEAVGEGTVKIDGTVDQYLKQFAGTFVGGITLQELATMTSGLPRMPCEDPQTWYCFNSKDPFNPYADYTWPQLEAYLKQFAPEGYDPTKPRPKYPNVYSNTGFALLGYLIEQVEHAASFEDLMKQRIAQPLRMVDTTVTLSAEQKARFATPYDVTESAIEHWDFLDVTAGAGGIRSTPADMMLYLRANLDPEQLLDDSKTRALGEAIVLSHAEGLGWDSAPGATVTFKNGQTGGFSAWIVFNKSLELGFIVLSNVGDSPDTEVLGNLPFPAPGAPTFPDLIGVAVPAATLASYVGSYICATGIAFQITLPGRFLVYTQNGAHLAVRATSQTDFNLIDGMDAPGFYSLSFIATGAVLHTQGEPDMSCTRAP